MANMNLGDTRLIVDACKRAGLLRNQAAYVLATAYWETARTMRPIREKGNGDGLDKDPWDDYLEKYDTGRLANVLGNTPQADGDGVLFCGRGYVQITGRRNYERASKELGVDFVSAPKKLLEPRYAAPILVRGMRDGWFTGKRLDDYITLQHSDFRNARRIVNGTDKAAFIAAIARDYDASLKAEGYGETAIPTPAPRPEPQRGILAAIIDFILKMVGGRNG